MSWFWIPLTLAAALLQSLRSAVQRHLTGRLSTSAAAFTRFAFGLPLALGYVVLLTEGPGSPWPQPAAKFWSWTAVGARYSPAGSSGQPSAASPRRRPLASRRSAFARRHCRYTTRAS